ncbi:hypothetical protein HMPREF1440_00936, partial [Helicobacter pylori HP250AFiV]
ALEGFTEKIKKSPNDSNAINEAFNDLKTELERAIDDERLKDLRENFSASLYADLKDKINAFSHRDRAKASKEREGDLAGADNESLTLAKNRCVKNCKKALE